jgi:D-psicose/D-tagatose/L-ribulose 3-epimerase
MRKDSRGRIFKYAMCNECLHPLPLEEQCRIIAGAGYRAIEIAPFTMVQEGVDEISPGRRKELLAVIRDHGLACDGVHWLFTPPPHGLHFTTADAAVRRKAVNYLHALIDFCGDLEGEVVVFGSPKARSTDGTSVADAKAHFVDGLLQVADHALDRGVTVLVEHLDHTQSDVVNRLVEAKEIMDRIGHPAVQMMFDFHNAADETEPFAALIARYFDVIRHVHVQEMDGRCLGSGTAETDYLPAFQALKDLGYNGWVSLEVFDFEPGGRRIAEASMAVLQRIESRLQ